MYAFVSSITAQVKDNKNSLPAYAIKTNALYWATTTPNLGFEIGLSDKFTLDLSKLQSMDIFRQQETQTLAGSTRTALLDLRTI